MIAQERTGVGTTADSNVPGEDHSTPGHPPQKSTGPLLHPPLKEHTSILFFTNVATDAGFQDLNL